MFYLFHVCVFFPQVWKATFKETCLKSSPSQTFITSSRRRLSRRKRNGSTPSDSKHRLPVGLCEKEVFLLLILLVPWRRWRNITSCSVSGSNLFCLETLNTICSNLNWSSVTSRSPGKILLLTGSSGWCLMI